VIICIDNGDFHLTDLNDYMLRSHGNIIHILCILVNGRGVRFLCGGTFL
jgi:hypothetical protein